MQKTYQQWILPSIILGALLFKLGLFLFFYHGNFHQITQPDSGTYLAPAKSLLTQGNYGGMFERTPGYPTFIAIIFALFGQHLSAIIITQIILSSLLIIEGYYIARRLFSPSTACFSAIFIACNFLFFGYTLMVLSDLLFAILTGLVFLIGVYLFSDSRRPLLITLFLGLAVALATLVRPISYYLIFPLFIGTTWYFLRQYFVWKKVIFGLFLLILPTVILVGSWQIRNKFLFNTYTFSNIAANNLYWIYMEDILRKHENLTDEKTKKILAAQLKKQNFHSAAAVNNFMAKTAITFLLHHPKDLIVQMLSGFPRLMISSDNSWVGFFDPHINYVTFSQQKHDLAHFRILKLLKNNSLGHFLLLITAFPMRLFLLLLYCFTVIGIATLAKTDMKKNGFAHLFLLGCTLYFIFVSSSASAYARFRVPFEILIVVYASYGLVYFIRFLLKLLPHHDTANRCINVDGQLEGESKTSIG